MMPLEMNIRILNLINFPSIVKVWIVIVNCNATCSLLYFLLVWSRPRHFPRTVTSTNQIMVMRTLTVMQCHANTSYILHCMATVVRE